MPNKVEVELSNRSTSGCVKINGQEVSVTRMTLEIVAGQPAELVMHMFMDESFIEIDEAEVTVVALPWPPLE